jgi:hypothetical protein
MVWSGLSEIISKVVGSLEIGVAASSSEQELTPTINAVNKINRNTVFFIFITIFF